MKYQRSTKLILISTLAIGALGLAGCAPSTAPGDDTDTPEIAVIWKDASSPYWLAASSGSETAKETLGDQANVTISAGTSESDVASQIAKVENAITAGAQAIVISPSAPDQLKPVLTRAQDEGIHVLLLDTNIPDFDAATFIGTDNRAGGATAYEALIDAIGDTGGKVGMIGGAPGVTSVEDRVAGFVGAAEGSSFEILETLATTSCDQESGVANAENLITAHPDLKAIFIGCGQPALGAIQAVKSAGLAGKITIIGFDFDPGAADALKEGSAAAFVNQAPAKMGSTGVESAYTLLTGGTIEKSIDTGVATITIDNVADFE